MSRDKESSQLPIPKTLVWAHSICTFELIDKALNDPSIMSIESDIVMGSKIYGVGSEKEISNIQQPIMSHPPSKVGEMTFTDFFQKMTSTNIIDKNPHRCLKKHLKLDFKEYDAINPTLEEMGNLEEVNGGSYKTIFLNADVLPGPGCRHESLKIKAEDFINLCVPFLKKNNNSDYCAFSLGWKVHPFSFSGYTNDDVRLMKYTILSHELQKLCKGVVLAVNARVLVKNLKPFDTIFHDLPHVQLLVWTGTGEPPISFNKISTIRRYFEESGHDHLVGFDCKS